MTSILDSTSLSNVIAIASLAVSALLGIYTLRQSAKNKRVSLLCFNLKTASIIGRRQAAHFTSRLKIQFDGHEIERLSVAEIRIWNAGNETIDRSVLVDADPLCIQAKGSGRIIEVEMVKVSSTGCEIVVEPTQDSSRWKIQFNYLNPGDGAIFRALYTAEAEEVCLSGSLKGATIEDDIGGLVGEKTFEARKRFALGYTIVATVACIGYALWQGPNAISSTQPDWLPVSAENYSMLFLFVVVFLPLTWWTFFPGVKRKSVPPVLQ